MSIFSSIVSLFTGTRYSFLPGYEEVIKKIAKEKRFKKILKETLDLPNAEEWIANEKNIGNLKKSADEKLKIIALLSSEIAEEISTTREIIAKIGSLGEVQRKKLAKIISLLVISKKYSSFPVYRWASDYTTVLDNQQQKLIAIQNKATIIKKACEKVSLMNDLNFKVIGAFENRMKQQLTDYKNAYSSFLDACAQETNFKTDIADSCQSQKIRKALRWGLSIAGGLASLVLVVSYLNTNSSSQASIPRYDQYGFSYSKSDTGMITNDIRPAKDTTKIITGLEHDSSLILKDTISKETIKKSGLKIKPFPEKDIIVTQKMSYNGFPSPNPGYDYRIVNDSIPIEKIDIHQYFNGHNGIDFTTPDKIVYSLCDGTIDTVEEGIGFEVRIKSDEDSCQYIYLHLNKVFDFIIPNKHIKKGMPIGEIKKVDKRDVWATGPHCHFSLKTKEGEYIDPIESIIRPIDEGNNKGRILSRSPLKILPSQSEKLLNEQYVRQQINTGNFDNIIIPNEGYEGLRKYVDFMKETEVLAKEDKKDQEKDAELGKFFEKNPDADLADIDSFLKKQKETKKKNPEKEET